MLILLLTQKLLRAILKQHLVNLTHGEGCTEAGGCFSKTVSINFKAALLNSLHSAPFFSQIFDENLSISMKPF